MARRCPKPKALPNTTPFAFTVQRRSHDMTLAAVNGVQLYWEETGYGAPVVMVHEFAGDLRSWEPQVRCLSRRYTPSPTTIVATRRPRCPTAGRRVLPGP